jgi:2-polyprenyl-3-methyl-5-hydroxy-6-metoxy-1,4-benzoquinol methylase
MTVKEHYNNHLGNFYSWYTGDFETNKNAFKTFCIEHNIKPVSTACAIDLGCGHGIQTIALAELGFMVKAIDFNDQLLSELKSKINGYPIEIFNDDILAINKYAEQRPELIICCGDTLTHLGNLTEIKDLIIDAFDNLSKDGKLILSFRDYSTELNDTDRFIPVKSDSQRILTCFIEYFRYTIRVTDLLHEFENGKWIQKVSSYYKTRIGMDFILNLLKISGFSIIFDKLEKGIITIIAEK